jgi:hypothetical protein
LAGTPLASASAKAVLSSQITPGQVTLTLSKQQYGTEDLFLMTIHNGLDQAIWTQDHQTSCSSLVLGRLDQGAWQPVGQCALARRAPAMATPAGSSISQRLDHAQKMATGAGWSVGTYRVSLTYCMSQNSVGSDSGTTVHSLQFTIL